MKNTINKLVVVGGGTAGWLTAGVIAAEHSCMSNNQQHNFEMSLVESPDIATIGVGEGTWPSMRSTLQKMGISETEFFRECSASFKQGTLFSGWQTGAGNDAYTHPFTAPHGYAETNLAPHWQPQRNNINFADAVSPQSSLFSGKLAPKQISTP